MNTNDRTVLLVSGKVALIDLEDVLHLEGGSLTLSNGYVSISFPDGYKRKSYRLHRYLLLKNGHVIADKTVHHKDGNPLNNQKANLDIVDKAANAKGKGGKKNRKKPAQWKGYDINETSYGLTYQARIVSNYKQIQLGTYLTEEDAAVAYDLGAIKHFGRELAILNFPDRDYGNMSVEEWRENRGVRKRPGRWSVSLRKECKAASATSPVIGNLKVSQMAKQLGFSRSRFYQLIGEVFPKPLRTEDGRPYYDEETQMECLRVMKSGIGVNGKPFLTHNSKINTVRSGVGPSY